MTPKTMLMHGGSARAADAVAALPSHVPAERPPFPVDEELAELPPLPVDQASADRPPIAVGVPNHRPLAAAEVSTIRPPELPAATPSAAAEVRTASLPPPLATPTAATRYPNANGGVNLPASPTLIGRRIGNFVVERELGQGGFGAVYLARHVDADLALHQVIKVLHAELSHRPDMVERFRGEVRAAAALSHPGIVHVEDFGQLETGEQYMVMEHLVGADLAAWLEQKGRLELSEALSLLEQAADALDAAHKRGIVHRDLKPSNLFRLADGRLKVLDFGIAKLMGDLASPGHRTMTGLVMGTPHYMAPEQAILGMTKVTPLADVFALGVIAYELVTGSRPWLSTTIAEYVLEINKSRPNPRTLRSDLPIACANAIVSALDPLPAQRPKTAGEFVRLLREGLAARQRGRRALHLALTAGGALLVAAGIVIGIALGSRGNDAAPAPTAGPRAGVEPQMNASPPIVASKPPPAATPPTPVSPPTASSTPPAPPKPAPSPKLVAPERSQPPQPAHAEPAIARTEQLPRRGNGELEIFVQPWASIVLDGKDAGQTPFRRKLPAGQYHLRLENQDSGKSENMVIRVTPDQTTTIQRTW